VIFVTALRSVKNFWKLALTWESSPKQSIAMGDGANDLQMMGVAGLSVAYHAKPKVREQAMVSIQEGGLDRLLEIVKP
jgi:phosphoserine phosphatase